MIRYLLLAVIFYTMSPMTAIAGKRIALVIGNNQYSNLPADRQLLKAVNDARAIRDTLSDELGFTVIYGENADWPRMNGLVKQLETTVSDGDIVFIYFSGHGVSIGGENYLLPSDIPLPRQGEENRLMGNSFGAEALTRLVQKHGAHAIFAVLDACRNNPFVDEGGKATGGTGGLTSIDSAEGVFTLFAAGLGQTALDRLSEVDPDPNSVFTRNLIPLLKTPGLSQVDLAKKLQQQVASLAASIGHDQKPAYYDQITGFITLKEVEPNAINTQADLIQTPSTANSTPPVNSQSLVPSASASALDQEAKTAYDFIKASGDCGEFRVFINRYATTIWADFARERRSSMNCDAPPTPVAAKADPPVESEEWYLATYQDVDMYGDDLFSKGLDAAGAHECAALCGDNLSCRAYTFNNNAKKCFLKTGFEFAQIVTNVESGLYFRARPAAPPPAFQAEWEVFVKKDLSGTNLGRYPVNDYAGCLNGCKTTSGCTGIALVHFTTPDQCWLKSGFDLSPITNRNASKGITSARQINQLVRPSSVQLTNITQPQ